MHKKVSGVEVECLQGDIASQNDMDAVVNAANAQLMTGGGVAGAIHKAAGAGLGRECQTMAPIEPGEAVISGAHNLPNTYVIHCLGPVYGEDKPEDILLASCYRNALLLAEKNTIESIAFPAISTGAFGYPLKEATDIAMKAVLKISAELKHVKKIRFVLHSAKALKVHEKALSKI